MLIAARATAEAPVFCPLRIAHGLAEGLPFSISGDGDANPLALPFAAIAVMGRHEAIAISLAMLAAVVHGVIQKHVADEDADGLRGGEIDMLALPGALAMVESRQEGESSGGGADDESERGRSKIHHSCHREENGCAR